MKKLSIALAVAFAIGAAAPAVAADYIPVAPAPAPSCHDTYGLFAIFHCWHDGGHNGWLWPHG